MKTAEEILSGYEDLTRENILKAMEEFADQFRDNASQDKQLLNLLDQICYFMGVYPAEVKSSSRKRELTDTRAIFCRRAREEFPELSWSRIASLVGRDHSSAIAAAERVEGVKEIKKKYNQLYANKTPFYYSTMAAYEKVLPGQPDCLEGKRSLLSYYQVEERKLPPPKGKPALCRLPD